MTRSDTKTRILDCAEHLFAREGFHNTSLRTLTAQADVNLASVNYHFGNKETLLQAVLERRLVPLNRQRTEKIQEVLDAAKRRRAVPAAGDLLRAFIVPTLEFSNSSSGARDFIALIGRSFTAADETVRSRFIALAIPQFQFLFAALSQALPHLPPAVLLARLQFAMGSLSHVMCMDRQSPAVPAGLPAPLEQKSLVDQLLKFIEAGLEIPA